ncbi:MAG: hypothetical protein AAFY15_09155 [Cyanobacteria bacterium J06648_11]
MFIPGLAPLSDYAEEGFAPQRKALKWLTQKHLRGGLISKGQAGASRWAEWANEQKLAAVLDSFDSVVEAFPEVHQWTVGNEVWLGGLGQVLRQVDPYLHIRTAVHVAKQHPNIEVWLGEYGLRNSEALDIMLAEVDRLRKQGGRVDGLIWIQYVDLAHQESDRPFRAGLKRNMLTWYPQLSIQTLVRSLERIKAEGLNVALETAVLTGAPSPRKLAAQRSIYQRMLDVCQKQDVDLMLWWVTDRYLKPWHSQLDGIDSPGLWTRDLAPKFPELIRTVANTRTPKTAVAGSPSRPKR